ncbi:Hemerythrin HHE cation binding domain-containing protein [Cyclobacterium lianum]|uniref:Hemerythrin HHE cation binding domain-containing protein n=1 Tax=Cyclobacterium lianum TaxID=388280 RepID=A0A1M7Q5H9_9BACT|nr:hemerythrin domain-containing protein [Cyclobacterium lianum]SHN25555.1 Hemerythrin HHE cation binding domain-containing protein [Cyclobacterium lianum]
MGKPLKRHPALVPLSKDHHFGLLLVWKIRMGLKRNTETRRILRYLEYFYQHHLEPHFQLEEQYVFSFLAKNDLMRKEVEKQHADLRLLVGKLLAQEDDARELLEEFAGVLEAHIRFEERKLFQHMQLELTEDELLEMKDRVDQIHEGTDENWQDQFWVK